MRTDPQAVDRITLIRSLKGCAASIVLALAIIGPMTAKDLQLATNYSDKPITDALTIMEMKGYIHHIGRNEGWKLSDGIKQLPLFPSALLGMGQEADRSESFRSPPLTTTTTKLTPNKRQVVEERSTAETRKYSDQPVDNSVDNPQTMIVSQKTQSPNNPGQTADIRDQLVAAGIGRNSPKLRQILATNPAPAYIAAHIAYYRWWQDQRRKRPGRTPIDGRKFFTTGMLITRILDGDPAPPPPPADDAEYHQHIPEHLRGIVQK